MEEPTNKELALMIKMGFENVGREFKEVKDRQDVTNGKVLKNDEFRLKNEELLESVKKERQNTLSRVSDVIWKLGTAAVLGISGAHWFVK